MPQSHAAMADDIDVKTLGRALWRAKSWIFGLAIVAGALTFAVLSMMRPLYTSEARILIQNDESAYTRPASGQFREQQQLIDEQAVQSQVQVLTSRDLAVAVINALDLINNPEFAKDGGASMVVRFLNRFGLFKDAPKSAEEKAANTFAEHLSVFQLGKSSVVAVDYSSGDPTLAAEIANKLAEVYLEWQRKAKLEQTKDATAWLSTEIEVLRKKVGESEAAVEQFRASQGLFQGSNNVTLNAQQLSELNTQLILAKAQRSEAEARARLIKQMLAEKGDIDATPEVLKSELIARLIDQRVQVQRQLAELSATLLPSHPRIKQLTSELADVRGQIRDEAIKIIKSLENEAEVASARETSLRNSLNEVKTQATGLSEAEVKLRALEREAKAQRDLLESYLARYRDASARQNMGAVPAQAAIVSRAHASILPSFPKRGPLSLLAAAAMALLALAFVLARELLAGPEVMPEASLASEARARARRQKTDQPDLSPTRVTAEPTFPEEEPAEAMPPRAQPFPSVPRAPLRPSRSSAVAVAAAHQPASAELPSHQPELPLEPAAKTRPQRPSFLPPWPAAKTKSEKSEPASGLDKAETEIGAAASSMGFLERLRRGRSSAANDSDSAPQAPAQGLLARIRAAREKGEGSTAAKPSTTSLPASQTMPTLRTNDLRHYLNQRLAASAAPANDPGRKAVAKKSSTAKAGPMLKSLDAVLNHILAAGNGNAPRAVLVAGVSPKIDSTMEAISIARSLVDRREQAILVDLARGAKAISGPLRLPRAPGLSDLIAARSSFEDVLRVDPESTLQIITAGNPKLSAKGDENEEFARIFEALTQVYGTVVLHADGEAARKFAPALKFELPIAVAVAPAGANASDTVIDVADFAALGCPVLLYEQSGKEPRSRLLRRIMALYAY